jgi:hypothetical protein
MSCSVAFLTSWTIVGHSCVPWLPRLARAICCEVAFLLARETYWHLSTSRLRRRAFICIVPLLLAPETSYLICLLHVGCIVRVPCSLSTTHVRLILPIPVCYSLYAVPSGCRVPSLPLGHVTLRFSRTSFGDFSLLRCSIVLRLLVLLHKMTSTITFEALSVPVSLLPMVRGCLFVPILGQSIHIIL